MYVCACVCVCVCACVFAPADPWVHSHAPDGTPCGSMYVYAVAVNVMPWIVRSTIGSHAVDVRLNSTFTCGSLNVVAVCGYLRFVERTRWKTSSC